MHKSIVAELRRRRGSILFQSAAIAYYIADIAKSYCRAASDTYDTETTTRSSRPDSKSADTRYFGASLPSAELLQLAGYQQQAVCAAVFAVLLDVRELERINDSESANEYSGACRPL